MSLLATYMDLEIVIEWNDSDRERQISYDVAYIWNLKNGANELIDKTEIESQLQKTHGYQKGKRGW